MKKLSARTSIAYEDIFSPRITKSLETNSANDSFAFDECMINMSISRERDGFGLLASKPLKVIAF